MQDPKKNEEVDRREFVRLLSGGALTATMGGLVGCGGGSGQGGTGGGGTGELGLGAITPEATAAALAATRAFVAALPALDLVTTQQRVLGFVQSRKEFIHSGTNSGSVWGLLPNGMTYTIFLNRYPQPGENTGPDSGRSATTRGSEVPSGTLAAVLSNAMGPGFRNEAGLLSASVNAKQYVVRSGGATIESLRSLGAPAFFYLSAHGDQTAVPRILNGKFVLGSDGKPIMDKAFAVSTTTAYDAAAQTQYRAEILRGEVGAGSCLEDIQSGVGVYADRLLITTRWVAKNWTFAKDGLIWISACSSNSAISQDFVSACLTKAGNAALYVGYSDLTEGDHAVQVSKFVIDRLLGTNKLSPVEDPPQRSFDFVQVYADLRKRGLHSRPTLNPATGVAFGGGRTTEVIFTQGSSSQFGLLAPSLAYVLVDEPNDQAILKGIFGTPPESDRAVLIGGLEAAVQSWDKDKIVVTLPRTGTGSSGDVVVSVRAHQSNVRRITEWEFDMRYLFQFTDHPQRTVKSDKMTARFRADVGDFRNTPGTSPTQVVRGAVATADSGGTMTASGSYTQDECTYTWSGSVTLTGDHSGANGPDQLLAYLRVDTATKTGAMGLAFGSSNPLWFTETIACKNGTNTSPFASSAGLLGGAENFPDPTEQTTIEIPLPAIPLAFGQDYSLPAGNFDTTDSGLRIRFDWDTITPKSPPDKDAARSASQS